jgi:transposase
MGQASTIGLDIAKWVFQAHGADAIGRVVFRKRLVRAKGFCQGSRQAVSPELG